ncbi:TNT domain-containing protein [Amycolatopsis suaedae]|uniref:DUF4237 domain-containing protein n=1 Tax=Amycolatopsis suaedae TaxID=2510978 RepID=A0A4Q7JB37_9PSEU|nr:TNT domain-containing protein [Amycolatopsis suaedae]RZQ65021.1 DUF4237 domain-containing protein [Amycolatopsis suaedae]
MTRQGEQGVREQKPHHGEFAGYLLRTYARYKDETFLVGDFTPPAYALTWTGQDPQLAAVLGVGPEGADSARPEQLTALWQVRVDTADELPAATKLTEDEEREQLIVVGQLLHRLLTETEHTDAQRLVVEFRQLDRYAELELTTRSDAETLYWSAPPELSGMLAQLRAGRYEPGRGTWLRATYVLSRDGSFDVDFDNDSEPAWRTAPDTAAHAAELARFPREDEHVPLWWRRRAGLPLAVVFQHARIVDAYSEGAPPVVDRPPLPDGEAEKVLGYLDAAQPVLVGDQPGPDIFALDQPPDVPERYLTDGLWIWHASVPYYLRKYGLPPDPDFLAHVRARDYRLGYVDRVIRLTAAAELLGQPRPAANQYEPETTPDATPNAGDLLATLRQRLGEYGVPDSAYRLGTAEPGVPSLHHTGTHWEVDGVRFDRLADATTHLLGTLLTEPATGDEPVDWPVRPAEGEPGLETLGAKRLVRLPAGTVLVRFGAETGNVLYADGVRFPMTSLPLDAEHTRRRYRLTRALYAVTGVAHPVDALPGGAVAYVLPKTIVEHLADASLEGLS